MQEPVGSKGSASSSLPENEELGVESLRPATGVGGSSQGEMAASGHEHDAGQQELMGDVQWCLWEFQFQSLKDSEQSIGFQTPLRTVTWELKT